MSGLLLISVFVVWLVFVVLVIRLIVRRFKLWGMKVVFSILIFPILLVAPLADELVGKWQFESLCKDYAVVNVDEHYAMSRRVVTEIRERDQYAKGTAVQIRIDPYVYRDSETNQVLVSYHTLHAQGGWLIRFIGISETNAPLLFNSGCAPDDRYAFKKNFKIKVIN